MDRKLVTAFLLGGMLIGGVVWMLGDKTQPVAAPAQVVAEVREVPTENLAEAPEPAPVSLTPRSAGRQNALPVRASSKPAPAPPPTTSSNAGSAPKASEPVAAPAAPRHDARPEPIAAAAAPAPRPVRVEQEPAPGPAKKREPSRVTIAAGTQLEVRLGERVSTGTNAVGDKFHGTLDKALVVEGLVIAEKGSKVEGKIASLYAGGKVKGVAEIHLELTNLHTSDGQNIKITTDDFVKQAQTSTADDAKKVGIGAGIGAAIGAIAGGGKGAVIGAGAGGAAGAGAVILTRGKDAVIPPESRMMFHLGQAVTVTEKID